MGMFSGLVGQRVDAQFRKNQSGQLAFLPFGPRRAGYYVDSASADQKIKPVLSIYAAAALLIQVLGSTTSYIIAQAITFPGHPGSLRGRLEVALIVYLFSAVIFWLLPAWLLWKLNRDLVRGLCSSLTQVEPGAMDTLRQLPSPSRSRELILVVLGFLVLGLALVLVSSRRPPSTGTKSPTSQH